MTTPATAAARFLWGMAFGIGLGILWDLLKPLARRHPHLCDLWFGPMLVWAWLEHGFGICQGDLRLGYTAALMVGWLAWEMTLGRALTRAIWGIWNFLARFMGPMAGYFGKKTKKFLYFLQKNICIYGKMGYNKME